jgi:streptomycin 3"-adenylyltransferase
MRWLLSRRNVAGILTPMTPSLAHEPRSQEQIAATTDIVREVLGAAALAAYLYGSAVAVGLRPGSDLDILVVSDRSLTGNERAAIVERLLPISGRGAAGGPARPIELTILARPALTPWRYPPSLEFQYGDWMRAEFERGELPDWPRADPDVAVLIETARRAAVPLIGPPVAAVLGRVPRADLVRAMVDTIPVLMPGIEEGTDIRNGLLTLARIWTTLATGEIRSKDEAARWALAHLPAEHRPVLAHARAAYLGEIAEEWRTLAPRLRAHVDHVVGRIQKLAAES